MEAEEYFSKFDKAIKSQVNNWALYLPEDSPNDDGEINMENKQIIFLDTHPVNTGNRPCENL